MKKFSHIVNNLGSRIFKGELAKERWFVVLIVTSLVTVWFRKGLTLGSGESGLPFYNTSRFLELLKSNWTDVPLGSGGSIGYPSFSLYAAIVFFQNLNIPSFIIQAAMFWFIFIIGALAVFQLATLIKGNTPLSRIVTVLFYIFNPIVHIMLLHRFQYPEIFFYAFMPLALLIYFKGLQAKNFLYLIALSLIGLIFSFTFVGPAFTELFFGVLALLTISVFLSTFRQKRNYFPLLYLLVFMIIFIIVNSWWLVPLFASVTVDLGSRGSVKYFNQNDNVITFNSISGQIESVLSVFRLFKPNGYLVDENFWAWPYHTIPFVILGFFYIVAFIAGLFKKEKQLLYKFSILLSLITMFWMKGSLPPFGAFTLFLFKSFTFIQVFRNPFEKIGMLLPLAMALPVGFGTVAIINGLASKTKLSKKIVAFLTLILVFPVYMFPIVTGLAFTGGPPPANNIAIGQYVKVPDYYKEARAWLDKQPGLFRVLVLPIDGEGMTYKWDYGFNGVELSNNLFNHSMISISTSQGYLPEVVNTVKYTLLNYPEKLWIVSQILNVKYIIVRDDIDYLGRETEAPQLDLKLIKEYMSQHFSPVAEFGKLKIFELNSSEYEQRIYTTMAPTYIFDPSRNDLKLIPFSRPKQNNMFISTRAELKNPLEDPYVELARGSIIKGLRVENITVDLKTAIERLPYVSVYRDTPFYALVRLKEELETQNQTPDTELAFRVNLLGKRLSEVSHSPQSTAAINEFYQGVKSIADELRHSQSVDGAIMDLLVNQREVLKGVKNIVADKALIDQIASFMDQLFIDIGARSIFPTKNKLIHRFYIGKDSKYEILIAKENWNHYFEDKGILEFDLDGKSVKLDSSQLGNDIDTFSLGAYSLIRGIHEVSIPQPKPLNLIAENLSEDLVLSSQDKQLVTRVVPVEDLNNNYTYKLSFEYLEEKGNVPVVAINSDVDFVDKKGGKIPRFAIGLIRDNYDFGWKQYAGYFTPFPSAQKHSLSFKVLPFGDCKAVIARPYRRYCEDNAFNQRVLRDSTYRIRSLKVEKAFQNPVVLRQVETTTQDSYLPKVEFEQITSARYKVKVTNAQKPFFLVLSTSFDPRWQAYFTNNQPKNLIEAISESEAGNPISTENHLEVNGYANAWYIDKSGNYEMYLEYSPERIFIIGKKFAMVAIITSLLILLVYLYKKLKRTYVN